MASTEVEVRRGKVLKIALSEGIGAVIEKFTQTALMVIILQLGMSDQKVRGATVEIEGPLVEVKVEDQSVGAEVEDLPAELPEDQLAEIEYQSAEVKVLYQ